MRLMYACLIEFSAPRHNPYSSTSPDRKMSSACHGIFRKPPFSAIWMPLKPLRRTRASEKSVPHSASASREESRMSKKDSLIAPLGEAVLILIVSIIGWASHQPLIFASLGPTAYELVEKP